MKRFLSGLLLAATCVLLVGAVLIGVYGIVDTERTLAALANDPAASGMDFMGVGWGYGICLFAVSALGAAVSLVSAKLQQRKIRRTASQTAAALFFLLLAVSVCLFYR